MRGRGCKGGTRADDDMQVGVVGGQGAEIGQVLTKKADTEHACPLPLLSPLLPPLLLPLPPSPTTTALMPLPLLPQQLLLLLLYRCCRCHSPAASPASPAAAVATPVTLLFSPCTHSSCLGFAFVRPSSFSPPLLRARLCFICVSCQT